MIMTMFRNCFRKKRIVLFAAPRTALDPEDLPAWMARDLGLDDPDNRAAVQRGRCRKREQAPSEVAPRRPRQT
ncbi:hypothetical protein [Roseibium sp. Sym1]|uniref:hypothetical protein n=1 Tax=Roseibium sp. Sym1 TaxID=3016006 RepID=UPI0022B48749|nr:hypothetical protein [Roseibium sp. Sym1]